MLRPVCRTPTKITPVRWFTNVCQGRPTFLIRSKSLVEPTLRALAATSWPRCLPFHKSANPPRRSGISVGS